MGAITASMLHAQLQCAHRVWMDAFADPAARDTVNPFVQLLWERGTAHEKSLVGRLTSPALDLSPLFGAEKEAATRAAIARREPLIYSGRLSVDDLLGEPDLLRWQDGGYVAIDIKSGAGKSGGADADGDEGKAKKSYGVQLALYTDILIRLGVSAGRHGFIWDVRREEVRYDLDAPMGPKSPSIWDLYLDTRQRVAATLTGGVTRPAGSSLCKLCVWHSTCDEQLVATNDLTLLPGLGASKRNGLIEQFPTVSDLAAANIERFVTRRETPFDGVGEKLLRRFKRRAVLMTTRNPEPYLIEPLDLPAADVELFFDIETDPMRDFVYLHGFVLREAGRNDSERFHGVFARDVSPDAEADAFAEAMKVFRAYPRALVVHYSKYERTEYRKLQQRYPHIATAAEIETLFASPRAIDLYYDVVHSKTEWPTREYSIKALAKFCGFDWRDADPSGASSIEWFDRWVRTGDAALRQRLLDYNEDDCRAMRVVMDRVRGMTVRV